MPGLDPGVHRYKCGGRKPAVLLCDVVLRGKRSATYGMTFWSRRDGKLAKGLNDSQAGPLVLALN
jgi:hypothetical protein